MEHLGDRFGLVVFDECHHLPGPAYALAARACVAPFRLGLTATPERADGRHADLDDLVGPIVYRKDIVDLSGGYLAPYETVRLTVELGPEDRQAHDEARGIYRDFVARNGIRMSSPSGWSDFIIRSSRSEDGRRAMAAYRRQREIAFAAPAKLDYVGCCSTATATIARCCSRRTTRPPTRSRAGSWSRSSPTRRACASAARSSPAWRTAATARS